MSIESDIQSVVEQAIRISLLECHRDNQTNSLILIDLDFVNRAGKKINVGSVRVPCVPRIGDKFEFNHGDRWNPDTADCVVSDVLFSNSNEVSEFDVEVTIREISNV